MKIKSIKFKVTTGKLKCHKCKERLKGNDGFIHIICEKQVGYWDGTHHIRICWSCLTNFLEDCKEDRSNRKKRYMELSKKAILRNL